MRTIPLIPVTFLVGFSLFIGFSVLKSRAIQSRETHYPARVFPADTVKDNSTVCKTINSQEIRNVILKSKSQKIILNIYPVKLSNVGDENQFDLNFIYQDVSEKNKKIGPRPDYKLFQTQSNWYIRFLKDKNVSRNNIPHGYFLTIDTAFLSNTTGISFCINPGKDQTMNYYVVSLQEIKQPDSTGKCPPDCYRNVITRYDSTGKCPPDCPSLLYSTTVKSLIEKNFRNK